MRPPLQATLRELACALMLVDPCFADDRAPLREPGRVAALRKQFAPIEHSIALGLALLRGPRGLKPGKAPVGNGVAPLCRTRRLDPRQPPFLDRLAPGRSSIIMSAPLRRLARFVAGVNLGAALLAAIVDAALLPRGVPLILALGARFAPVAAAFRKSRGRDRRREQQRHHRPSHVTHSISMLVGKMGQLR
ncbi:MAG TPA: hypothetical protein VF704_00590 [Allosphingosinicella sp.]